jgi:hypothetical protein
VSSACSTHRSRSHVGISRQPVVPLPFSG